jgi:hypothetical protein
MNNFKNLYKKFFWRCSGCDMQFSAEISRRLEHTVFKLLAIFQSWLGKSHQYGVNINTNSYRDCRVYVLLCSRRLLTTCVGLVTERDQRSLEVCNLQLRILADKVNYLAMLRSAAFLLIKQASLLVYYLRVSSTVFIRLRHCKLIIDGYQLSTICMISKWQPAVR